MTKHGFENAGRNKVYKLIARRNKAIHAGEDYPVSDKEAITDEINETILLIGTLQNNIFYLQSKRELEFIRKKVAEEFVLPLPSITIGKSIWFFIYVRFVFFEDNTNFPDEQTAQKIIERICKLFHDWDHTLTENRYSLSVRFLVYPSGICLQWENQEFKKFQKNISLIPSPDEPERFQIKFNFYHSPDGE